MARYSFEFLGEHADDTAALTFLRSKNWDTNGDGTGDPHTGVTYFNTTTGERRQWNGFIWQAFIMR